MKDIEDNSCQGSCQLKRKLDFGNDEEEATNNKAPLQVIKRFNFYRLELTNVDAIMPSCIISDAKRTVFNTPWKEDDIVFSIFHPPKA